ncbi:unnamed protein product [Lampetra planeri]
MLSQRRVPPCPSSEVATAPGLAVASTARIGPPVDTGAVALGLSVSPTGGGQLHSSQGSKASSPLAMKAEKEAPKAAVDNTIIPVEAKALSGRTTNSTVPEESPTCCPPPSVLRALLPPAKQARHPALLSHADAVSRVELKRPQTERQSAMPARDASCPPLGASPTADCASKHVLPSQPGTSRLTEPDVSPTIKLDFVDNAARSCEPAGAESEGEHRLCTRDFSKGPDFVITTGKMAGRLDEGFKTPVQHYTLKQLSAASPSKSRIEHSHCMTVPLKMPYAGCQSSQETTGPVSHQKAAVPSEATEFGGDFVTTRKDHPGTSFPVANAESYGMLYATTEPRPFNFPGYKYSPGELSETPACRLAPSTDCPPVTKPGASKAAAASPFSAMATHLGPLLFSLPPPLPPPLLLLLWWLTTQRAASSAAGSAAGTPDSSRLQPRSASFSASDSAESSAAHSFSSFTRELFSSHVIGEEDRPLPSPPPLDPFVPIRSDDCGIDKGCFRYGAPGCDADSCEYFLSYRRLGEDVEFELSADTDGWVGVGFSSDRLMGGDDVMACVHFNGHVRVQHYNNVGQWVREQPRNPARDDEAIYESGRVTCRFKRALAAHRNDAMVDLHLSWYYLLAWGPASHGLLTRHDMDTPPVTDSPVSVFRYEDVYMPSAAYQTCSSPGCLLVIVAITFYTLMGVP